MGKGDGTLVMEDARIIFRNFAGKEGMYNREGDRNFCVLLEPDLAETMAKDGWNIKTLRAREADDDPQPYIQVSVGFKGRPPLLVMITSRGRTQLAEDEVELLDWVDIAQVDLIIRPYEWTVSGKTGIKAYLKSIFVTVAEDELMLKYADVPEIGSGPQRLAIEGGNKHFDYEGEIVEDLPARAGRVTE
jgi:hypothetical protein